MVSIYSFTLLISVTEQILLVCIPLSDKGLDKGIVATQKHAVSPQKHEVPIQKHE